MSQIPQHAAHGIAQAVADGALKHKTFRLLYFCDGR